MPRGKAKNSEPVFVPSSKVALKSLDLPESWLERKIREDHTILGLSGITKTLFQRRYRKASRVDLVLLDEENNILYCAELMLGELDESHIVRALDYWLSESRKPSNKGWQVVAVLAAESIRKSRYFPVVEFLSQKLPLTVLEVAALNVGGKTALTFTKFLDGEDQLEQEGGEEEDSGRVDVDRSYWASKRPAPIMRIADSLAKIFRSAEARLRVTYLQGFWGFALGEKPKNFVTITPKQKFVNVRVRIRDTEMWGEKLKKAGLDITGGTPARSVRFRVVGNPGKMKKLLRQLGEEAYAERVRET
jgi:hypothetical protein